MSIGTSHLSLSPVNLSYASRYLCSVSLTTSSGILTPSFPFKPELVNQSRSGCCTHAISPAFPISGNTQQTELTLS